MSAAVGRRRSKFGPTIMRAMCGMTRPTHPITPEIATTLAVISVAAAMTAARTRPASMPSDRASIDPPAQQNQGDEADQNCRQCARDLGAPRACETSEQPECDRGKLVIGIREDLEQRDRSARERADNDTAKNEHERGISPAHRTRNEIDEAHGCYAADEREPLDGGQREREENAENGAEPRACRDAQDVGRDERVAEKPLIDDAGAR